MEFFNRKGRRFCNFALPMFENLQNRLEKAFKSLKGQGRINEVNVADTVKEIRRALIAADVNFKVAKDFTDTILEKAKGQDVIKSVSPGQLLTKIVNDELVVLLGGQKADLQLNASPTVILIAGLQGSGKPLSQENWVNTSRDWAEIRCLWRVMYIALLPVSN